jgi:predicted NodU family carbamoyl transferase
MRTRPGGPAGSKTRSYWSSTPTGSTDGNSLTESYTLYRGGAGELELIHAEKVDATLTGVGTLGMLYEEVTRRIGFVTRLENGLSHAESEKTMGLAPYGGESDESDSCKYKKQDQSVNRNNTDAHEKLMPTPSEKTYEVGTTELESVTSCMSSKRSNQLSYAPKAINREGNGKI